MEHQQGHGTNQADAYGNPAVAGHGAAVGGQGAAGEQVQPIRDDKPDGVLRRSGSSSSSSSSEDDGMGGRRKKPLKEKIKEKLPGQKNTNAAAEGTGEKKPLKRRRSRRNSRGSTKL